MKVVIISTLVFMISSCEELDCFSNVKYATEQANQFCHQLDNKIPCDSIKINDKALCESINNLCVASDEGTKIFIRIPYYLCNQLEAQKCDQRKECRWTSINFDPQLKDVFK